MQNTKLNQRQKEFGDFFSTARGGPWSRRSLGLISLLLGFYLGSNLTVYYLQKTGQRSLVAIVMVIAIELLVRLRSEVKSKLWPLHWVALDNLRVGAVYAVVLEAFKLGS